MFRDVDGVFVEEATVYTPGGLYYGIDVAVQGDRLVVGAPGPAGDVAVFFEYDAMAGTWDMSQVRWRTEAWVWLWQADSIDKMCVLLFGGGWHGHVVCWTSANGALRVVFK